MLAGAGSVAALRIEFGERRGDGVEFGAVAKG